MEIPLWIIAIYFIIKGLHSTLVTYLSWYKNRYRYVSYMYTPRWARWPSWIFNRIYYGKTVYQTSEGYK